MKSSLELLIIGSGLCDGSTQGAPSHTLKPFLRVAPLERLCVQGDLGSPSRFHKNKHLKHNRSILRFAIRVS